jgi:outer membrane protein
MEREIQEMQQQLKEQQLMLSEERQQEMLQEIQQKTTEYQRFLQETFGQSGLIAQKNQELMEPIMNEIDRAVNELSEEEGFDFIFDNAVGLIYGKPAFDITEQILSKLDAE